MGDEEAVHLCQRRDRAGRADLAEGVAEEHLGRAAAAVAERLRSRLAVRTKVSPTSSAIFARLLDPGASWLATPRFVCTP